VKTNKPLTKCASFDLLVLLRVVKNHMNEHLIEFALVDSYSMAHGVRSTREAPNDHPESKAIAGSLSDIAKSAGASIDHTRKSKPEKLAKADHFDLLSAEKIIETSLLGFGGIGGVTLFFKLAKDLIIKWLEISTRHKIKVKIGDATIEVTGNTDLEKVVAAVERLRENEVALKLASKPSQKGTQSKKKSAE